VYGSTAKGRGNGHLGGVEKNIGRLKPGQKNKEGKTKEVGRFFKENKEIALHVGMPGRRLTGFGKKG